MWYKGQWKALKKTAPDGANKWTDSGPGLVKIYGSPNTLHIQYNSSLYFMKQESQNLAYIYGDKMPSIMDPEILLFSILFIQY